MKATKTLEAMEARIIELKEATNILPLVSLGTERLDQLSKDVRSLYAERGAYTRKLMAEQGLSKGEAQDAMWAKFGQW